VISIEIETLENKYFQALLTGSDEVAQVYAPATPIGIDEK